MKKSLFAVLPAIVATLVVGTQVFAQSTVLPGSAAVSGSAGVSTGASSPAIIAPEPIIPPPNGGSTGFVQFNNLTVESVSATNVPAEIVASNGYVYGGAPIPCTSFDSADATTGTAISCPLPPHTNTASPTPSAGATSAGGSAGSSGSSAIALPAPYRIEVTSQTELMLRDRTAASLSDFSNGDQINVFGYYNADGSITAYLVRDISKPVETQTMQLNNATLVSISGTSIPATLAVTQAQGAPCYGFNANTKSSIACPLGISSFSQNGATANVQPTPQMAPMWMMLRKYVVNVDSRTIILDSNRNAIPLSSLSANDSLNVYGESSDNGQTIDADIIRDLSIPVQATTFSGTVSQVNTDGSFVIQTNNGQTLTVQNPVSVGESVTLQGILNSAQNIISQITRLTVANGTTVPPPPVMVPMMRVQGSPYPTSTSPQGGPINY